MGIFFPIGVFSLYMISFLLIHYLFIFFVDCEMFHTLFLEQNTPRTQTCLLYTSDAADDLTRLDLGGRRIIKKRSSLSV